MHNRYAPGVLLLILLTAAFVARSEVPGGANPGAPANATAGRTTDAPKASQFSAEENAVLAEKFSDATVRPSGLRFIIRTPGTGDATPRSGQEVTVNYEGRLLLNGKKFDSSYDRHRPFTFMTGVGRVIPGWDVMIQEMKLGEKRTVIIPWSLGYGTRGAPPLIPPKASLVFEIELLDFH
jgi:FKBP-type peptidyl-prolyl cis-trans isomerase